MTLKEKIDKIVVDNGLSSKKHLATVIEVSYNLFSRNLNKGNLTGEMLRAFVLHPEVKVDLRWLGNNDAESEYTMLVNEPGEQLTNSTLEKFNLALKLLEEIRSDISKKNT